MLLQEAHAAATDMVKIPMSERYVRSLNLATSVGELPGPPASGQIWARPGGLCWIPSRAAEARCSAREQPARRQRVP